MKIIEEWLTVMVNTKKIEIYLFRYSAIPYSALCIKTKFTYSAIPLFRIPRFTGSRYNNTVYYGFRYSSFLANRATKEIRAAFHDAARNFFSAYNLFIVTWVITDNKEDLPELKVMANIISYACGLYSFSFFLIEKCISVRSCL